MFHDHVFEGCEVATDAVCYLLELIHRDVTVIKCATVGWLQCFRSPIKVLGNIDQTLTLSFHQSGLMTRGFGFSGDLPSLSFLQLSVILVVPVGDLSLIILVLLIESDRTLGFSL